MQKHQIIAIIFFFLKIAEMVFKFLSSDLFIYSNDYKWIICISSEIYSTLAHCKSQQSF